ncbi:MAG: translocation/assembly module TamB domain-containing protein [Acidobacteriota bacterium]|nr:translocation/assembly module TamB domain-containing protein [Acidobacteriota bacterium]
MDHEFALEPDVWRLHSAVPSLGAFSDLRVDPDSWDYRLHASLEDADLGRVAQFWTSSACEVAGAVTLRVEAAGAVMAPALSDISVDLDRLDARVQEIPVVLGAPVRVRSSVDGVALDGDFQLKVGGGRVVARGGMRADGADVLTVRVLGDLRDLHVPMAVYGGPGAAATEGSPVELSGPFRLEAEVGGTVARPVLTGNFSLDDAVVGTGKTAPLTDLSVRARYDETGLSLGEVRGRWDNATMTALGFVPVRLLAPYLGSGIESRAETMNVARLHVRLDDVRPEVLSGVVDPVALEEVAGALGVVLDLEADALDLASVRATGTLRDLDLRVAGLPITQRGQTRVRFENGRLAVERFAWRFGEAETVLTLGGEVEMLPEPTASLALTGTADLSVLNAFSPGAALGGTASLAVNLGGTIAQPSITGAMKIMDGEVRVAEPRFWFADLNGGLVFQGASMHSVELGGTANGGAVQLDVDLEFLGLRPQGTLGVQGQEIPVVLPPGIRAELGTSLVLTLGEVDTELGGTVTIHRGDYREPVNTAGGLRALMTSSSDLELLDMNPSALDRLRLNVRVRTGEEIVVNNNYGVGTLGGDVRVVGTWGEPGVVGRATVGDGSQLFLGGNRFEIETGTIDFADPDGVTPELDVAASTRVGGNLISLTLEGTADTLTSTLEAEPPLPESDIVSLLLTGRRLDEVESAPGVAARDQALGLVSGEVLGVVGRSVGLDTVRLDRRSATEASVRFDDSLVAGEANPGTRLTVGKNVSRQVELVASQNLRESGRVTWIVNFLPRRNVELRLVVDDETDRSYEFRHAVRFGATGPRRVTSAPSSVPRVTAVHVTGDGPLSESELRGFVRLQAGDRFDFVRWQESRDRIEEALWQLGFLEASVRARRSSQVAEGVERVALQFDVSVGPRTILDVQGYQPPRRVRRAMEAAWRRAVGDVFLFEELTDLIRRHLVEEGFLRPVVTVDVVVVPDEVMFEGERSSEKRIIVRIEPGPRFRERAIQFAGGQRLEPTQLSRLLTVDRANDAWVGGDALTRAVLAMAQGDGLLTAAVRVAPPVFNDDAATLTVELEEGAVFRVDEVVVDGAERWSAEQVLAAAGVMPGEIFRPGLSEEIRTGILLAYRRAGFTMARVGVRSIVDRSRAMVKIRVEVAEGRRQLLTAVEVEGAVVTDPRIVDRALRLTRGSPVDPVTWGEARKRLYESGVFRSVDITAVPEPVTSVEPSGDDQPVTAKVLLEEWPLYRLRYGLQLIDERAPMGGADTRGAVGAVADLTRQNLFGRAVRLGTAVRYDAIQRVGRGFMVFPSFLGHPVRSQVFVSRLREVFGSEGARAVSDRVGLTLEQRIEPREGLTVSYSYSWDRDRTLEQRLDLHDPRARGGSVDIARVNGSVIVEDRDDIFDTTKGAFHSSTLEWGVQVLGSDRRMFKYVGQQNYFRPLGDGVVLASAVRLGVGTGFGPKLLRSERFYAGGGTTVRGYPQDALGPVDTLGHASGGDALLVLNQEVRFPVWGRVGGVGFLDAGNVFPAVDAVSLAGLQVGTGLGLRVGTPVGLFRIDYGIPLSESTIDAKGRWFASIGQAF